MCLYEAQISGERNRTIGPLISYYFSKYRLWVHAASITIVILLHVYKSGV